MSERALPSKALLCRVKQDVAHRTEQCRLKREFRAVQIRAVRSAAQQREQSRSSSAKIASIVAQSIAQHRSMVDNADHSNAEQREEIKVVQSKALHLKAEHSVASQSRA